MDELYSVLWDVIDYYGLDHIYTITVIVNLIVISEWKDIKNWSKLAFWKKTIVASAVFGGGFMNLFCLLRLVGVFDF